MQMSDPASFVPDPQNGRQLRDAFGRFATGVTIVTATGSAGECVAITANSFSSVSMEPPLVLWSPARASTRYPVFAAARHYAIHVLAADQADLAWTVARNRDALCDLAGRNGQGVPILDRCLARFDCQRFALHEAGDHAIVVGRVLQATLTEGAPLAFFGGRIADISVK